MGEYVKQTGLAGYFWLFCLFCFSAGGMLRDASGATLKWEMLPDRERLAVLLNNEEGFAGQVSRVATNGLLLNLGLPPVMGDEKAPEGAKLFQMASPRGRALGVFMQTAAFGYIVSRPDRHTVIIDVFADPLGERWKPGGSGATPGSAAPPATTASGTPAQQAASPPAREVSRAREAPPSAAAQPSAQNVIEVPAVPMVPASPRAEAAPAGPAAPAATPAPARPEPTPVLPMPKSPQPEPARKVDQTTPPAKAAGQNQRNATLGMGPAESQPPDAARRTARPQATAAVAAGPNRQEMQEREAKGQDSSDGSRVPQAAGRNPQNTDSLYPFVYVARYNPGGLEDWQGDSAAAQGGAGILPRNATSARQQAATAQPQRTATQPQASATVQAKPQRNATGAGEAKTPPSGNATAHAAPGEKIIYVDSQGRPVEPPPDPVQAIAAVRQDASRGDYAAALDKAAKLLLHPELSREQREEVMHLHSEMLFMSNRDKLDTAYDKVVSATVEAMNYNLKSPRNAVALLRLGYINLKMNNTSEAGAYFNMLRRQYPLDENIPLTYYYWGEYHYDRGEMQRAADQFQYVVQHYAESQFAREAALGLARSFAALGYYKQAHDVADYIDKRWPRFYLDFPPVLEMMGDVGFRLGHLEYALSRYWTYFNVAPDGPAADIILTRIGDVYSRKKLPAAAKEIYSESYRRFPKKDGGLVALMRLAEEGINDAPTLKDMFTIFEGPFNLQPAEAYRRILADVPASPLVPLARYKLAMWNLWNKQYEEALGLCSRFIADSPNHELAPKVQELALSVFAAMSAEAIAQNRPAQVHEIWNKYPVVRSQEEALDPESRVALGVSLWKQGNPDKAVSVVEPFFLGAKIPNYSEMALDLTLNIYLEHEQWQKIKDIAERVALWNLSAERDRQLRYALALAHQNLGEEKDAVALWSNLYEKGGLQDVQQTYVEYFLAQDALARKNLEQAYAFGHSALNNFLRLGKENPANEDRDKVRSLLSMLMDVSEAAGRFDETLDFAHRFLGILGKDDPQRQGIAYRMSQVYRKQGNTAEWRKTLRELAEAYPASVYGRTAASELNSAKLSEDAAKFSPTGQL